MCPQGCSLDRSEVTRPGDYSTTVRLRSDADEPAKPVKRRGRKKGKKKSDAEVLKDIAGTGVPSETWTALPTPHLDAATESPELPKNEAPVTPAAPEVQEKEADSR